MTQSCNQPDIIRDLIRPEILALKAYHVPPATGMIKLDAMENPYTLPHALQDAIAQLTAETPVNRYPDPHATDLKAALREALAVPEQMAVMLGNGSDEIIQIVARRTNQNIGYNILITMHDKRSVASKVIYKKIKEMFKDRVFNTVIELDEKMKESLIMHQPVQAYAPESKSAKQYSELANEFIEKTS